MAGNYPVAGAVLASLLLHGTILYLPMNPVGLAPAASSTSPWVFVALAASQDSSAAGVSSAQRELALPGIVVPSIPTSLQPPVPSPEATAKRLSVPTAVPDALPESLSAVVATEAVAPAPDRLQGSEAFALAPLTVSPGAHYYRVSELTHHPALKAPVLKEEAGRLYPVSDTLLAVRISTRGNVDNVVVLSTNNDTMAAEAAAAFTAARYFPGRIGQMAVRSELLIHVESSPMSRIVTSVTR